MSDFRVFRFLLCGALITLMAVGYVHQQIEVVKMGYALQKNRTYLASLVDQNSKLMYNLSKLESPKNLLRSLGDKEIRFAARRTGSGECYQLAQLETESMDGRESLIGKFFDLFSPNAEARTRK